MSNKIDNGAERVEELRKSMHREIDSLIDDVVLKKNIRGFTITFDCGVDRVLTMDLRTDGVVKDDNDNCICLRKKIEGVADNEQHG